MNLDSEHISLRTEPVVVRQLHEDQRQSAPRLFGAPMHRRVAERSMRNTPLHALMSPTVRCVAASASVRETVMAMQASECNCVVIVENGTAAGIVTERDMLGILADTMMWPTEKLCIKNFMSAPALCLRDSATLHDALMLTRRHDIGQIPVLDAGGKVVGLLTREQLDRAHLHAVEKERDAIEQQVYSHSRELSEANRELQALALEDGLLKVGNRRAMEADVESTHLNAIRYGHSYALGLVDVDHFKLYNDHYGHCAGDRALVAVANCIKESIRRGDRVYRYGGEELLVLMPGIFLQEAMEAMSRLTGNLFQLGIEHRLSAHQRLTVSVGVSAFAVSEARVKDSWRAVLEEADAFLYRAKAGGRNQVHGWATLDNCPAPQTKQS